MKKYDYEEMKNSSNLYEIANEERARTFGEGDFGYEGNKISCRWGYHEVIFHSVIRDKDFRELEWDMGEEGFEDDSFIYLDEFEWAEINYAYRDAWEGGCFEKFEFNYDGELFEYDDDSVITHLKTGTKYTSDGVVE